ncbi:SUMF1/EgtB/PvdO family nonheme iron enzyme [Streptomyces sp. CAU 1734]|uniref:caspase, EACC1-associated type n=1 Tax=Streptomyces sp. CAU 1734 TaxID=3140360 RepID=UPI0032617E52
MPALPDPHTSRAVLLGTGTFERPELPDISAIRNNLSALAEALRSERVWGLPRDHCVVVPDPSTNIELLDPIVAAAQQATDTLILYYAGHGLVDSKHGDLHLTLTTTDTRRIYTAVPYSNVRDIVLDSRAARRIVILDCCYSGRALGTMADPATTVVNEASAEGTYILAAAAENKIALAPPGEPFTAFTGAFLDTLRTGIPGESEMLNLDAIYNQVLGRMRESSRPLPQKRDRNTAGRLSLVHNQAHPAVLDLHRAAHSFLQVDTGVAEVTRALLTELFAEDPAARRRAAEALARLDNREEAVLTALDSSIRDDLDHEVRRSARNAFLQLGDPAEFGMIRIPAGDFVMGTSDRGRAMLRAQLGLEGAWTYSESPERRVSLPSYFIDRTPVTNAEFDAFVRATGYRTVCEIEGSGHVKTRGGGQVTEVPGVDWAHPAGPGSTWRDLPDHPVTLLAWPDVAAYAAWAGKQLPTEAQWEKAARGTGGRLWPWGDTWREGVCNVSAFHAARLGGPGAPRTDWWQTFDQLRDAPLTTPVGSFPDGASPYGLLDCAGNVCERTSDWYDRYPDGWDSSEHYGRKYHVLRGGAFHHGPELARTAARDFAHPLFRTFHDGFRCVVNVPE